MTKILKTVSALAIAAATLTAATLATGSIASANPYLGHGPVVTNKLPPAVQRFGNRLNITCLACRLPRPMPVGPEPTHGWNHGWYHGFGWRYRPEIYVGGVAVAAPAQIASAPAAAPSQVAAGPCNCLTKQDLPDGSVLFQDICTKQSAVAPAMTVGAR